MQEQAVRSYVERVIAELWQELPFACANLGVDGLGPLVRDGVTRAAAHGFTTEVNVYCFVRMMLLFGPRFDEQPWAADALRDCAGEHENDRLDYLALAADERLP